VYEEAPGFDNISEAVTEGYRLEQLNARKMHGPANGVPSQAAGGCGVT